MPRYEGKYTPLREHPFCNSCGTLAQLSRCSRCKMVWYCSVDCQKSDFTQHKRVCRDIASKQAVVDRETAELQSFSNWHNDDTTNLFETAVGSFWVS